ncbi:hypothetical protein QYF36_008133 [Acer negundo]|nr:hypothetical protein QYF36_008133 [Acer negundo]
MAAGAIEEEEEEDRTTAAATKEAAVASQHLHQSFERRRPESSPGFPFDMVDGDARPSDIWAAGGVGDGGGSDLWLIWDSGRRYGINGWVFLAIDGASFVMGFVCGGDNDDYGFWISLFSSVPVNRPLEQRQASPSVVVLCLWMGR